MSAVPLPDTLDTLTCLRLGEALFRFLARLNEESEMDDFSWEDAGVSDISGFIEIDRDALGDVQAIIEVMRESR